MKKINFYGMYSLMMMILLQMEIISKMEDLWDIIW